jgi:hypothetical protein
MYMNMIMEQVKGSKRLKHVHMYILIRPFMSSLSIQIYIYVYIYTYTCIQFFFINIYLYI